MSWNKPVDEDELLHLRDANARAAAVEKEHREELPAWAQAKLQRLEAEVERLYRELYGAGREEAITVHEHKIAGGLRFASPESETVAHATGNLVDGELVIEVRGSADVAVELGARNAAVVRVKKPEPPAWQHPELDAAPYVCRCPGRQVPHKIGERRCELEWAKADATPTAF